MKKVLFISIVAVASLASCKKDYTCTCTQTANGVVGTPQVTTYTEAKKADARAACLSYSYTAGGVTVDTKCELN